MPKFTHYPWIQRLLGRGINKDIAPELVPDGLARDAFHVRPTSSSGATGAVEAVGGEQLLYPAPFAGGESYVCIGSSVINGRHVAFWASPNQGEAPCVVIDGILSAQSPNIPYVHDRPLQIAPEERCRGGILYPADGESLPLYWDVDDMVNQLQLGTAVYFSEYTTEYNSVALSVPAEFPVFDGLFTAGNGLPVGQYVYSIRYVTPAGDRTNRSPETPQIAVPVFQDFNYDTFYPGARTTGGGQLGVPTQYGVRLRWRVDNSQGYQSIEVCRQRFNDGQGLTNPGIYEVVARIPLEPNQFGILTYTDPGEWTLDPPEPIATDEAADQLVFPNAPKAVEIAENRLLYANVKTTPQVIPLQFGTDSEGRTVNPITQRLTTISDGQEYNSGHMDPVNIAYYRSFGRGEKYGFAVVPWDGNSSKLPAVPIQGAENYQFPNRRDPKGPLGPYGLKSLQYSTDSIDAANTQVQSSEPVTPTFDVLTQGSKRRATEAGVTLSNVIPQSTLPFVPMRPIAPTDPNQSVNTWGFSPQYGRSTSATSWSPVAETGNFLAQRHHAIGLLVNEITGIPSNIKAITIARSEPAGRVVASGFGFWDMRNGTADEGFRAQRSSNSLRCHFPDIDAAMVQQDLLNDLFNNPQNYRIQLVGSYGFYQDVFGYGSRLNITDNLKAFCADMLLHATVTNDPTGQVNAGAASSAWTAGPNTTSPPGSGYIGLGRWRNPSFYGQHGELPFMTDPDQGNVLYNIQSITEHQEGRGRYFRVQTGQYIYTSDSQDTDGFDGLNSDPIRRFHQPVYAINIVRLNADVTQGQVPLYTNTATTIKTRAVVGLIPPTHGPEIEFELVGERLEDVRPFVFGQSAEDIRYVWVKTPGLQERAWVNITNMDVSVIDPAAILSDIQNNGFWLSPDGTQVYGIYEVVSSTDSLGNASAFSSGATHFIKFSNYGAQVNIPPSDSRIIVKFCGKNVRVFGGDRAISRQIFSPYDIAATMQSEDNCLQNLPPMPTWGVFRPTTYVIPLQGGQANPFFVIQYIESARQIAVLWDGETRTNTPMDLFTPLTGMSFPRTNFISRPYSQVSSSSGVANGFFPEFDALYQQLMGQNVASEFSFGGIPFPNRFPPVNYDYSKTPNQTFAGLPEVGFDEEIDQCTAIYASNEYFPGSQDIPGLRTFLSSNIKYISNENGEIKVIASALSGAGRNIYAWTERGVTRILYNKSILVGASGEQISTQQVSNLWGDEMLITRNIGLPDQMWRNFVKGYAPTGQGYADSFFWMDRKGAYRMTGDNIIDISRDKILSELAPTLLNYPTDYSGQFAGLYNVKDDEVWFYAGPQTLAPAPPLVPSPVVLAPRLFVYNARLGEWVGKFDFRYDNLVMRDRQILGNRQLETYALDVGDIVNGQTRVASIRVPFFGEVGKFKQHLRWRFVGAGDKVSAKPDEVRIYDAGGNLLCIQNFDIAFAANPTEAQFWVLWYDGWEQHTASILASVDPQRRPPQSEGFFVELIWNTGGYKNLLSVSSQLQPIR